MKIDFAAFLDSLKYMVKGMVGIFIVTAVIAVVTVVLNRLTKEDKE